MIRQLNPDAATRRGYLVENYRVFHLNSIEKEAIPSHFHEFHKIILVQGGCLRYVIEGCSCEISPGQILLVPAFSIHQPVIAPCPYDRIVLWIATDASELGGADASFRVSEAERRYVLEDEDKICSEVIRKIAADENPKTKSLYAKDRYESALLTELLVLLGRKMQEVSLEAGLEEKKAEKTTPADLVMEEVIAYINQNLTADLSTETLSRRCYLSKSHLCRRFQEATGCSLHQYVLKKRLIHAARLIKQGKSAAISSQEAGFSDYSTFFRAFRKAFEVSPQEFHT